MKWRSKKYLSVPQAACASAIISHRGPCKASGGSSALSQSAGSDTDPGGRVGGRQLLADSTPPSIEACEQSCPLVRGLACATRRPSEQACCIAAGSVRAGVRHVQRCSGTCLGRGHGQIALPGCICTATFLAFHACLAHVRLRQHYFPVRMVPSKHLLLSPEREHLSRPHDRKPVPLA